MPPWVTWLIALAHEFANVPWFVGIILVSALLIYVAARNGQAPCAKVASALAFSPFPKTIEKFGNAIWARYTAPYLADARSSAALVAAKSVAIAAIEAAKTFSVAADGRPAAVTSAADSVASAAVLEADKFVGTAKPTAITDLANTAARAVALAAKTAAEKITGEKSTKDAADAVANAADGAVAEAVKEALTRFGGATPSIDRQGAERAQNYLERVVDRQINKVRGILTFDSILIVAIRTTIDGAHPNLFAGSRNVAMSCLWIAVLICLSLCFVRWGTAKHYDDAWTEFEATTQLIRRRTILVQMAVILSGVSVVFGLAWPHIVGLV